MKRALLFLLSAVLIMTVSPCSAGTRADTAPTLQALTLTQDEQDMVNLVKTGGGVYFTRFTGVSQFKNIDLILYVYQKGEFIDSSRTGASLLTAPDGKIAVMAEPGEFTGFRINLANGNSIVSWKLSAACDVSALNITEMGGIRKMAVAAGAEYPLFARLFTSEPGGAFSMDMLNSPEKLRAYDYACVVKCAFH